MNAPAVSGVKLRGDNLARFMTLTKQVFPTKDGMPLWSL